MDHFELSDNGSSSASSDPNDWIRDLVAQMIQSKEWKRSIQDFIDEHCVVFNDEPENAFTFTDLHNVGRTPSSHVIVMNANL